MYRDTFWSHHTDDGKEYYKHNISLFPLDKESSKLNFAYGTTQDVMADLLISLFSRFELLIEKLASNKTISEELHNMLLTSDWKDAIPNKKNDTLYDKLDQVEDAENHFWDID